MEEEHPLSNTPKRRSAEFVATGPTLEDVVCEPESHLMKQQVGVEVDRSVYQDCAVHDRSGLHLRRMAESAADVVEYGFAPDGACAWIGVGLRRVHEPHHQLEHHPIGQDVER